MKLASWNVNSLNVRLEHVLTWFDSSHIDILALQETKVPDLAFPATPFLEKGLYVTYSGQKTYNGVAIISRLPIKDVTTDVEGFVDPERRIMAATIGDIRLINLYVPNGQSVLSDKYQYKMTWLQHVTGFIKSQLQTYPRVAVVGDFNIAPDDRDVHSPEAWAGCVLVSPAERDAFSSLLGLGLTDSYRLFEQPAQQFSWWDYRAAAFRRNLGMRIDHILLSKALTDCCLESAIDPAPRRLERPSDHAPVWVTLSLRNMS